MGTYNNEIEQFIYTICYRPMWEAAYTYIAEHPYALNLSYSRIQNPDSATLEDMILEFTKNIRIDEDNLLFDAVVSCTKHRMYAAIKHILYDQKFVACRCPSNMVYPQKNEEWSDVQRME